MSLSNAIVYIVDDDAAIRNSLSLLIKSIGYTTKLFSSANNYLQDEANHTHLPGCMLLDVRMPGMSGLELLQVMNEKKIDLPVIILTGHADVPIAIRAMKSGAVDFFEKPFNEQVLLECVQYFLEKGSQVHQKNEEHIEMRKRLLRLSKREREVMELIVSGNSSKKIASELCISPKTVDVHRSHIQQKLKVNNIAALVRVAFVADVGRAKY